MSRNVWPCSEQAVGQLGHPARRQRGRGDEDGSGRGAGEDAGALVEPHRRATRRRRPSPRRSASLLPRPPRAWPPGWRPAATRSSAFAGLRFHTATAWPPRRKWSAIAWPMIPRPITATSVMADDRTGPRPQPCPPPRPPSGGAGERDTHTRRRHAVPESACVRSRFRGRTETWAPGRVPSVGTMTAPPAPTLASDSPDPAPPDGDTTARRPPLGRPSCRRPGCGTRRSPTSTSTGGRRPRWCRSTTCPTPWPGRSCTRGRPSTGSPRRCTTTRWRRCPTSTAGSSCPGSPTWPGSPAT